MNDISINVGGYWVNIRVGAMVFRGDDVLVCRGKDKSYWYLPGGRVKTNESSLDALRRELAEEVGETFRIVRPIVCSENFFETQGRQFHELCTYYFVEWIGNGVLRQQPDAYEVFAWIHKNDVPGLDLRPSFIAGVIAHPPPRLELVIHRDGRQSDTPR